MLGGNSSLAGCKYTNSVSKLERDVRLSTSREDFTSFAEGEMRSYASKHGAGRRAFATLQAVMVYRDSVSLSPDIGLSKYKQ